ncbi:hypothetical protein B7494_g8391 [Chlorociboria aeruginascens]|nr:hypothetical protein B7494_g8391 [Chlorociboria aeruginascens]
MVRLGKRQRDGWDAQLAVVWGGGLGDHFVAEVEYFASRKYFVDLTGEGFRQRRFYFGSRNLQPSPYVLSRSVNALSPIMAGKKETVHVNEEHAQGDPSGNAFLYQGHELNRSERNPGQTGNKIEPSVPSYPVRLLKKWFNTAGRSTMEPLHRRKRRSECSPQDLALHLSDDEIHRSRQDRMVLGLEQKRLSTCQRGGTGVLEWHKFPDR